MDRKGVATWLAETVDSHDIYLEEKLKELEAYGITVDLKACTLSSDGRTVQAPLESEKSHRKSIAERGLGGWVNLKGQRGFSGWVIAETLCDLAGVQYNGSYFGRGRIFWACIEALRGEG